MHPPVSFRLVTQAEESVEDSGVDEVVVRLQGVICDLSLPPVFSAAPGCVRSSGWKALFADREIEIPCTGSNPSI